MTELSLEFPDQQLHDLFQELIPDFQRAGWLPAGVPDPQAGWLMTPADTIPLLLLELPADQNIIPVIVITLDEFTPDEERLYSNYVDVPSLARGIQSQLALKHPSQLRLFIYAPSRGWHYSGKRDQAIPLHIGANLSSAELDSTLRWYAAPRSDRISDEPAPKIWARELQGWLRKWENELAPEAAALEQRRGQQPPTGEAARMVRELLQLMALCRVYRHSRDCSYRPGALPPVHFVPLDDDDEARWGIPAIDEWKHPLSIISDMLQSVPAQWLPGCEPWLTRLAQWSSLINDVQNRLFQRLLSEYTLLTAQKFAPRVFADAFCTEEELRRAWKMAITHPVRIASSVGATDGETVETIHLDSKVESPGRFADWIEMLYDFWNMYLQTEMSNLHQAQYFPVQTDILNPLPETLDYNQLFAHYMKNGMARSLRIHCACGEEGGRCRIILSALSMGLMHSRSPLKKAEKNLAFAWLGEEQL
ncbi:hypothetical protein JXA32_16540 [Candidatus Sumerlaeota bacterium]|nr:hypothetical protein [Candidatus Sumerlaeota bacterium]